MNDRDNLLTRIEIEEAIVGIRKDDIIHVYYKSGITLTVPLQKKMLQIFFDLTKGEDKLFIWEAGPNVRLTREARLYAAEMEKDSPCEASVVVVRSWYQKVMANFYYKLNRPGVLYKVTSDFQKGIEWLHQVHADVHA